MSNPLDFQIAVKKFISDLALLGYKTDIVIKLTKSDHLRAMNEVSESRSWLPMSSFRTAVNPDFIRHIVLPTPHGNVTIRPKSTKTVTQEVETDE